LGKQIGDVASLMAAVVALNEFVLSSKNR
jgi:hypothetical protein